MDTYVVINTNTNAGDNTNTNTGDNIDTNTTGDNIDTNTGDNTNTTNQRPRSLFASGSEEFDAQKILENMLNGSDLSSPQETADAKEGGGEKEGGDEKKGEFVRRDLLVKEISLLFIFIAVFSAHSLFRMQLPVLTFFHCLFLSPLLFFIF
jgi:hypothetical protein